MSDTFGSVWHQVRLRCPMVPALLTQDFVRNAWREIIDRRRWSFLRRETEILINDAKYGTCDVTRGSNQVTGGTIAYDAQDVDRQFRVGVNEPIYTIISASPTQYTLDRVYGGSDATGTLCSVLDAFAVMPENFESIYAVLDTSNNWQLRYWVTEDELNSWDPQRSASGTPRCVVSRRYKTQGTAALIGRVQYEIWPYATSQKNYPLFYYIGAEALTDSTPFPGLFGESGNVIMDLALAEVAEWPGPEGRRNPYFNLNLAAVKRKMAGESIDRLEVKDENIYLTWLETVSWINRFPFAPLDAAWMQNHEVSSLGW